MPPRPGATPTKYATPIFLHRKKCEQVMLARSMTRTISIVGAGRVGRTLGRRLRELGWRIGAVVTRSASTSRAAVRFIGAGIPIKSHPRDIFEADVILISTPDNVLAAVARSLSQIG